MKPTKTKAHKSPRKSPQPQPMQPIVVGEDGVIRFQQNALVRYLIDLAKQRGVADMNTLALLPGIAANDREQFAQLIGYSVDGFAELPYASAKSIGEADRVARYLRLTPCGKQKARCKRKVIKAK